MSLDLAVKALEEAVKAGASYTDVRIGEILDETLTVKNGVPADTNLSQTRGFGIRVVIKGAWGVASSIDLTKKEVAEVARKAVAIAKASAKVKKKAISLNRAAAKKGKYSTPMKKNPFNIPLEEKMEILMDA